MIELVHPLSWDSNFFKRKVGYTNIFNLKDLPKVYAEAASSNYTLLYIYSGTHVKEYLKSPFLSVDVGGHITFSKKVSADSLILHEDINAIEEYIARNYTPTLLKAALLSGQHSRFRVDSYLPSGSFEKLYKIWLENTILKWPKTGVYIYLKENVIAGMITAEWVDQTCTIGLISVLPSYQGCGIGSKLLAYVERLCIDKDIQSIEVKTQLVNKSARALYLKNSFKELERSFLYHGHRNILLQNV